MAIASTKMSQVKHPAGDNADSRVAPLVTTGHRLTDRIGNTPLLRIERIAADFPGVELLGKAEWYNPGGSVKLSSSLQHHLGKDDELASFRKARRCLILPAGTPALRMQCRRGPEDFQSLCVSLRTFRPSESESCKPMAPTFFTPIRRKDQMAPFDWRENLPLPILDLSFLCRPIFKRCQLASALSNNRERNLAAN